MVARGHGALRGLYPPLQSMPGAQYSNSSVMLLILGEAHGKYEQYEQVDRGVMPPGRCVLHRGKLGISPLGMAGWEAY